MGVQRTDITGHRYGRLVAQRYLTNGNWECRCDCGRTAVASITAMRKGLRVSCGCYHRELVVRMKTVHAHSRQIGGESSEYRSWRAMKQRCLNPNASQYAHYGGRGITICDAWRNDFRAFLADMGLKPSPRYTIERDDNDGPYAPGNCRWVPRIDQSSNSRQNRFLEFKGVKDTAKGWARRTGMTYETILGRMNRGWPDERTLTEPTRIMHRASR